MSLKSKMDKLRALEGAVVERKNPHLNVLRFPSPSVNFVFGNGWGLPFGYTAIVAGPPKGGKSVLCNAAIGQMHKDYPTKVAIKFNTELREQGQLTEDMARVYGIDMDRYMAYDVNNPELIFDRITKEIAALCSDPKDPLDVGLIIIDSTNEIQGRREKDSESMMVQQIGDQALTIKTGLRAILPVQRKFNIALIMTSHVAAEMDMQEQKRTGKKFKMAAAYGTQHHCEYFMMVEPNVGKEGRLDAYGNEMLDDTVTDMMGKGDQLGHKIRVKMLDSSMGPKKRTGEFTMDYHKGIINQFEEIFELGVARGVITRPTNLKYSFGGKEWVGRPATLKAIEESTDLQQAVLDELRKRDLRGDFASADRVAEAEEEQEND